MHNGSKLRYCVLSIFLYLLSTVNDLLIAVLLFNVNT